MSRYPESLVSDKLWEPDDAFLRQRRQEILDIAERLFAENGLLPTSLAHIRDATGISYGPMRGHFSTKDAVVGAVLERHLNRLIERVSVYRGVDDNTDPNERLVWAIHDLLAMMSAYKDGQRVFTAAIAGAAPHIKRALKLRQRHLAHFYAGLIADAVPEAAGRTELAMPAAMNLMGMAAWSVLWFRQGAALSFEAHARLLAHMLIAGLPAAAAAGLGAL